MKHAKHSLEKLYLTYGGIGVICGEVYSLALQPWDRRVRDVGPVGQTRFRLRLKRVVLHGGGKSQPVVTCS